MALYFATVLPGLETILESEIRVKITEAKDLRIERGKVFFHSSLPVESFTVLRTADNLYMLIHRFRVGPHKKHLADIQYEISRLDLSFAVKKRYGGMVRFKVNASRMGHHTYSRFDAAEAAAKGIARRDSRFREDVAGAHQVEFRLDIYHEDSIFAVRLTDASYRYRSNRRRFTTAALRPTVAHALVWASSPQEEDRFIDPCCGSGTILSERLAYPYSQIYGGDLSAEAVEATIENTGFHERLEIKHWDARNLPIDAAAVDKVITNLPFGRKISAGENIPKLYDDLLREMKRIVKNDGVILCLTDAGDAVQDAVEKLHLSCSPLATLCLKGVYPTLYRLNKGNFHDHIAGIDG